MQRVVEIAVLGRTVSDGISALEKPRHLGLGLTDARETWIDPLSAADTPGASEDSA
jgi:hypothetical protein